MSDTAHTRCTCNDIMTAGKPWCPIHDGYSGVDPESLPIGEPDDISRTWYAELARLRAENEKLRAALVQTADQLESYLMSYSAPPDAWDKDGWGAVRAARSVLEQTGGTDG